MNFTGCATSSHQHGNVRHINTEILHELAASLHECEGWTNSRINMESFWTAPRDGVLM